MRSNEEKNIGLSFRIKKISQRIAWRKKESGDICWESIRIRSDNANYSSWIGTGLMCSSLNNQLLKLLLIVYNQLIKNRVIWSPIKLNIIILQNWISKIKCECNIKIRLQWNSQVNKFQTLLHRKMSRCEHGQIITIYCLNETCTWRQAGGCQNCFRRYHSHPSNIGTITQEKLDQLYRKMIIRPDPKPKSRVLQQAIYNYFVIMKTQITTSIDAVSRAITQKLNNPFLNREGQLEVFNKIKNKQYRKINKKQLKKFCQFANQNSKETLEQNQSDMYLQQITNTSNQIQQINQAFVLYSNAVKELDNSFLIQNQFVQKINELVNSISAIIKQGKPIGTRQQSDTTSKSRDKTKISNDTSVEKPNLKIVNAKERDRKVSLDFSNNKQFPLFKHSANNENELYQRKKRLLQLGQQSKKTNMDEIKVDLNTNNLTPQNKNQQMQKIQLQQKNIDKQLPRQLSVDKGFRKFNLNPNKLDGRQEQDQLETGQKILHTTLPREVSRPKLYQLSKQVKEKKIKVPVKISNQEDANCPSPILKRKKTLAKTQGIQQSRGFNLFKVESKRYEQDDQQTQQISQNRTEKSEAEQGKQQQLLKQKQTYSLALLTSSLSVSAEKAIPLLQAAIKYAHNNLSAAEYLSYLYLEIGKPRQCLSVCNKFLQQMQESPDAQQLAQHLNNNKAAALNMLGRYSESINILQKCLQNTQKDIYYKNLGDAYFSIGIFEKAAFNYQKAIKMNTDMDEALFNLSVCLYMQGNLLQSQLNILKALKINPKNQSYIQLHNQLKIKLNI